MYKLLTILLIGILSMGMSFKGNYKNQLKVKSEITLEQDYNFEDFIISTGSGDINLKGWNKDQISIQIKYYEAEKGDAEFSIKNGRLTGISHSKKGFIFREITGFFPISANLNFKSGSGNLTIENMSNSQIYLNIGSGNIDLSKLIDISRLELDTGSGDIKVNKATNISYFYGDTGSGSIAISTVNNISTLICDTGSGDVTLDNVTQVEKAKMDTGSGDIHLIRTNLNNLLADTGSGDIILEHSTVNNSSYDTGSGEIIKKNGSY